jgi:hypothetical protein
MNLRRRLAEIDETPALAGVSGQKGLKRRASACVSTI